MRKRVVITGLGCVSPLGNDVSTMWGNISTGKSGVGYITHYDTTRYKVKIAAEVKDFNGVALFGTRDARRMDRYAQFALASALQALQEAQLTITDENRDRIGIVLGCGIGGMGTLNEQTHIFFDRGHERVSPLLVPMMLPDAAASMVGLQLGARGPNLAIVAACASGTNAIGEAFEMVRHGRADVVLSGGCEAVIVPIAMAGLTVMTALSTRNEEPERASRPFDKTRDGFVMGEGAGVVVLESLDHAVQRGATILGEIIGYGTTNDAFHISAPAENGEGAAKCMQNALADAKLGVEDIGYINAHGTSTLLNDRSETQAIKYVFGDLAYKIPVSSTKSMTGHLLGAAGALEAVICIKSLQDGILPPTINYETPDPECDLDYVPNQARQAVVQNIMSNSFGFGGHNASIILSRYRGA
ncbi:MAG: beta-ketoacyl-ACP synthase II [Anaerolineae bacterium]|nr:beta-ketoacyl-ACP synthase II [Anaerolineae bacterium]